MKLNDAGIKVKKTVAPKKDLVVPDVLLEAWRKTERPPRRSKSSRTAAVRNTSNGSPMPRPNRPATNASPPRSNGWLKETTELEV